jgi:aryl-alcohol dehydrogenase-like predicted oxidoreductase
VILRWHIEHGFCAIPKSVKPHRIAENFDVFDFALEGDEVAAIDALDTGVRGGPDPELLNTETMPLVVDNSEPSMEYRPLGRTGVSVSKLCLGTMMFGSGALSSTSCRPRSA